MQGLFENALPVQAEGDVVRTRITREPPADAQAQPLDSMHVMVWDPKEGRVVRVTLPFWLLRLSNRGSIHFSSDRTHLSFEHLHLTVEDLVKHRVEDIDDVVEAAALAGISLPVAKLVPIGNVKG